MGRKCTELDPCGPWSPVAGDVKVKNSFDFSLGGANVNPWVGFGDVEIRLDWALACQDISFPSELFPSKQRPPVPVPEGSPLQDMTI